MQGVAISNYAGCLASARTVLGKRSPWLLQPSARPTGSCLGSFAGSLTAKAFAPWSLVKEEQRKLSECPVPPLRSPAGSHPYAPLSTLAPFGAHHILS